MGAHQAIALVNAENYMGHFAQQGRVAETLEWRVDRQKSDANVANIQVQRNGVQHAASTVAVALIPNRYHSALGGTSDAGRAARVSELTGAIQEALNLSLRSHRISDPSNSSRLGSFVQTFSVTGEFSSPQRPFESRFKTPK
jgi:hypothetical protein